MTPPPADPSANRYLPWRWAWPGWLLAAAALVAGVPPFLRMPPWCDLTLYDMAARAVMSGGVHYRDIFDTNLPGFVWLLVGVRRLFGPSMEAVRAVDLLIVSVTVWLLLGLTRRAGATRAGVAWMAAGAALFYPFSSEFNHCQRDVWMLLPALVAVRLRLARPPGDRPFRRGLLEGAVWGAAVWIKPHVVIPAAAVWLCSADRVGGSRRGTRADFFGNLAGGTLVGAAGVGWLVGTGTWPHFWDVFTKWNGQYLQMVWMEFGLRAQDHLYYFVPWSFLHPLALVLAVRFVWPPKGPRRWFVPAADDGQQRARTLLAALFVAWSAQAFLFQRRFHYVHVPETFLLMAVLTVQRWAVTPAAVAYLGLAAALTAGAEASPAAGDRLKRVTDWWPGAEYYLPRHPALDPYRWGWWGECWRTGLPDREYAERQDEVSLHYGFFASVTAGEIQQLADELRRRGAADGEVLCWHDSPHAVYLPLGHRPRFRFMHISTVLLGDPNDSRSPYYRMRSELRAAAPGTRYVVTDLKRHFLAAPDSANRPTECGPDLLPPALTPWARQTFPFDQPAVFRTRTPSGKPGRYLIHERTRPIGLIEYDVDPWAGVD